MADGQVPDRLVMGCTALGGFVSPFLTGLLVADVVSLQGLLVGTLVAIATTVSPVAIVAAAWPRSRDRQTGGDGSP